MTDATAGVRAPESETGAGSSERQLRVTGAGFAVALLVHGADHVRRGTDVITDVVLSAGAKQNLLAVVVLVLVLRGRRVAPATAVAVGLAGGVGFVAAHLLPQWGAFSDPLTNGELAPGANAFSWFAASFEIGAALPFGLVGLRLFKARQGRNRMEVRS